MTASQIRGTSLLDPTIAAYRQRLTPALERLRGLDLPYLDTDVPALEEAFGLAYEAGLFELHTYPAALQNLLKLELFRALCPLSGSLAFLGIQILAANRIMQSNGFPAAEQFYRRRCGIAVNHLRAPVRVVGSERTSEGYRLSGRLTWASGYRIFDTLLIGFHHEGNELQAVVPFKPQPGFKISTPEPTFVGNGMQTVTIDLGHYFLPDSAVVCAHPIGRYTAQKSVSRTVHMALYGTGLGIVNAIDDAETRSAAAKRLESLREAFMATDDGETMDDLRITLFQTLLQSVTTGMILNGGRSILLQERLQRYYRELIMFHSNGLNDAIKGRFKAAYLQR
jgi:hypothetical protein